MSTRYVYLFAGAMTVVAAGLLAGLRTVTEDIAKQNEDIFNKRAILSAVADPLAEQGLDPSVMSGEEVLQFFEENVVSMAVSADSGEPIDGITADSIDFVAEIRKPLEEQRLPLYKMDISGDNYTVLFLRGNGLWDAIWGNIALSPDLNTIAGVTFDHAAETAGLGARIKDDAKWVAQWKGEQIYNDENLVGIRVVKGGALADDIHAVDGLTGATITADGVEAMLDKGLAAYQAFLNNSRQTK
ncbi:MAG: NADH:ubiquinone reductase (Na(+)-transporting) subunit C [Bacteroidota bacterium]